MVDDALVQNGTLLFTDEATIQCIAVSVFSTADDSCLSLSLSSPTTVSGLTLSPALATICVIPTEGELLPMQFSMHEISQGVYIGSG